MHKALMKRLQGTIHASFFIINALTYNVKESAKQFIADSETHMLLSYPRGRSSIHTPKICRQPPQSHATHIVCGVRPNQRHANIERHDVHYHTQTLPWFSGLQLEHKETHLLHHQMIITAALLRCSDTLNLDTVRAWLHADVIAWALCRVLLHCTISPVDHPVW